MPLYYEDLTVGRRFETPRRTVTEADLVRFAGVSGDFNPLHMDEEFAKTTPFGRRVAHGTLVLAISQGLRQSTGDFHGTLMALLEIRSWRFLAPVHIGDTVGATTEISEMRETSRSDRGLVVQRVRVTNHHGEVVQEGELVSLVRRRPERATRP